MIHFDLINFGLIQSTLLSWWRQGQIHSTLLFWCSPAWPCHHNTQESSQGWECCWDFWARISSALLALISTPSPGRPGKYTADRTKTRTTRRRWRYTFHSSVGMLFSWHRRGFRVQGVVGISYNRRSAILFIFWLVYPTNWYILQILIWLVYPTIEEVLTAYSRE